jgi:phosphodiesterase/alkaline phosphatase D-like protein
MTHQKTQPSWLDRRRFLRYTWRGVGAGLSCRDVIPFNPHIRYYEGDRRGYFKATVTPRQMRVDLRFVTTVESPTAAAYTAASWVVEDGVPGAVPA